MCHQYIKGTGIITFDRIMKKKGNITVPIGTARELAPSEILSADSADYLLGGSLTMRNGRIDKELDRMHGLDTYDYGARQYNPIVGRWDRMDQSVEKSSTGNMMKWGVTAEFAL